MNLNVATTGTPTGQRQPDKEMMILKQRTFHFRYGTLRTAEPRGLICPVRGLCRQANCRWEAPHFDRPSFNVLAQKKKETHKKFLVSLASPVPGSRRWWVLLKRIKLMFAQMISHTIYKYLMSNLLYLLLYVSDTCQNCQHPRLVVCIWG